MQVANRCAAMMMTMMMMISIFEFIFLKMKTISYIITHDDPYRLFDYYIYITREYLINILEYSYTTNCNMAKPNCVDTILSLNQSIRIVFKVILTFRRISYASREGCAAILDDFVFFYYLYYLYYQIKKTSIR